MISKAAEVLFSASEAMEAMRGDSGEEEARGSKFWGDFAPPLWFSSPPLDGLRCCLKTGVLFLRLFLIVAPFVVVILTSRSDILSRDFSSSENSTY